MITKEAQILILIGQNCKTNLWKHLKDILLRPNSKSKEATCVSGQGFNINSTKLFLI